MPRVVPDYSCLPFVYTANFNLRKILSEDMKGMALSHSKTVTRAVKLLSTCLLGACISLASTLAGPAAQPAADTVDASPSAVLPALLDTSASFTGTGGDSTATGADERNGIGPESPAAPANILNTRVASGEPGTTLGIDGSEPDHGGCVPEPLSLILMTSGLLGLIGARRLKKSARF